MSELKLNNYDEAMHGQVFDYQKCPEELVAHLVDEDPNVQELLRFFARCSYNGENVHWKFDPTLSPLLSIKPIEYPGSERDARRTAPAITNTNSNINKELKMADDIRLTLSMPSKLKNPRSKRGKWKGYLMDRCIDPTILTRMEDIHGKSIYNLKFQKFLELVDYELGV